MTEPDETLISRLREARDVETALARTLAEHIEIAPAGEFRAELERHLQETCRHANRVSARLAELDFGRTMTQIATALFEQPAPQAQEAMAATERASRDLEVFENAKDACVAESREIALYAAIEERAREVDDDETAQMAATIRAEEERMLDVLLDEIPHLAAASSGRNGRPSAHVG